MRSVVAPVLSTRGGGLAVPLPIIVVAFAGATVRDEERIAATLDRDSVATLGPTAFGWSRAAW